MTRATHDSDRHSAVRGTFGADELAAWGLNEIAYVKPILVDGDSAYGIYSADGLQLGVAADADAAEAAARHNDLYPLRVH